MNKCIISFLMFLLITSCNQQVSDNKEKNKFLSFPKQIKEVRTYYYEVNTHSDSIGYFVFEETGEITSISSLKIIDKYVLLCDAVHSNVKKIDLETGKLISSKKLDIDSSWIDNIAYFNSCFYVFTLKGNIFILDKNLEMKTNFSLPNYFGKIEIYSESKDSLIIYRNPSDIDEDKNHNGILRRTKIDKKNHYSIDSIWLTNDESLTLLRKETGKEVKLENKLIYVTNNGMYEIPESIELKKMYDCKRIDYSSNFIVTFEVNPKLLKLNVYEYK